MTTITNKQYYVNAEDLQRIFLKYNIRPEYPIDATKFVEDVHSITGVSYVHAYEPYYLPLANLTCTYETGTSTIPKE